MTIQSAANSNNYVITIKPNAFAEVGYCFQCKVKGNEVIIYEDISRAVTVLHELEVIPIEQFREHFIKISEDDYEQYMLASCNDEQDIIQAIRAKYLH